MAYKYNSDLQIMIIMQNNRVMSLEEIHFPKKEIGEKYRTIKMIGKGSYGYVVKAQNLYTSQYVAIKKITDMFNDPVDTRRILRELMILRKTNHPNIIKFIQVIPPLDPHSFTSLYLVTQCCQADLNCMFKSEKIFLEADHVQFITYQILCGLKYLHSLNIIHRDLKPANVLINQGSIVKICDFGLSRSLEGLEFIKNEEKQEEEKAKQKGKFINEELCKQIEHQYDLTPGVPGQPKIQSPTKVENKNLKKLIKIPTQRKPQIVKQLTRHVTTRWYRAPQVILLEKKYDSAIDMWSVGCIFGELLHMVRTVCPEGEGRAPLFPGQKCFPLSPGKKVANSPVQKQKKTSMKSYKQFQKIKNDQLDYIFSFLGSPSQEDINFVTDEKAKEYLRTFKFQKRSDFYKRFPGATPQALDFLSKVLMFDPKKRLTVDEALIHPFFKKVRNPISEIVGEPIFMTFQSQSHISIQKLRELFIAEFRME